MTAEEVPSSDRTEYRITWFEELEGFEGGAESEGKVREDEGDAERETKPPSLICLDKALEDELLRHKSAAGSQDD
jgi:hypothetical protein